LKKWVDDVRIPADYLRLLGKDRLRELALKLHLFSEPVDYGY
jgi:hypothetical protein